MTRIRLVAVLTGLAALTAGGALAQDAPPPGCRWQGYQGDTILACKDGKGHWRRSGDDLIVGTYPMAKPKPKPKPVAAVKPSAAAAASAAATVAAVPAAVATPPAPTTAFAAEDAGTQAIAEGAPAQATDADALSAAGLAVDAAEPAAVEPPAEPPAKRPWWMAIWEAILNFLRTIGLLK